VIRRALRWIAGVGLVTGLAVALAWVFIAGRAELETERERVHSVKVPPRTARSASGDVVVTLDGETQKRISLTTEALAARTLAPEITAWGTLQEDPSRSFTLRAPVAGQLAHGNGRAWPSLGDVLGDRAAVGLIEPRVLPVDRVDLTARLAAARADVDAVGASRHAARAALDRAKIRNAESKIVSDRAVQETEARVRGEEARLDALTETVRLLEASLAGRAGPTGVRPLVVERGGEVVEVFAQPGESVESGQPILRLARFDRLVARVVLPAGQPVDRLVSNARIVVLGHEDRPLTGEPIAVGAPSEAGAQGQALLFRVKPAGRPLRPGAALTAHLPLGGPPAAGVVVPRSAVVRFAGRPWVYVQVSDTGFTRREVALEHATEQGWFVTSGVRPGDRIVVAGAQTLLSEEFKSQIPISEEGD
jgi:hypothetical protein